MPILEHDDAIAQYYETVKDKYPDIDYERFRTICRSPFLYIKLCIKSLLMPIIKIKYLGTFRVYPPRIIKTLTKLNVAYSQGRVPEDEYVKQKEFLEGYLKKLEDEKNPQTIREVEIIQE